MQTALKRDFEGERKKNHELNEHYSEKCRQLQKLQVSHPFS